MCPTGGEDLRIDAGCETEQEARQLLDLYLADASFVQIQGAYVRIYIREIDRDKATSLMDVMHSLMVRGSNDGV